MVQLGYAGIPFVSATNECLSETLMKDIVERKSQ